MLISSTSTGHVVYPAGPGQGFSLGEAVVVTGMAACIQVGPHLIAPVGDAVCKKVHGPEAVVFPLVVAGKDAWVGTTGVVELVPLTILGVEQSGVGEGR